MFHVIVWTIDKLYGNNFLPPLLKKLKERRNRKQLAMISKDNWKHEKNLWRD